MKAAHGLHPGQQKSTRVVGSRKNSLHCHSLVPVRQPIRRWGTAESTSIVCQCIRDMRMDVAMINHVIKEESAIH